MLNRRPEVSSQARDDRLESTTHGSRLTLAMATTMALGSLGCGRAEPLEPEPDAAEVAAAIVPVPITYFGINVSTPSKSVADGFIFRRDSLEQSMDPLDWPHWVEEAPELENGLHLEWVYDPRGGGVEEWEFFPTTYWPSCSTWVADHVLLIAGRSPVDGAGIIERWTFEPSPDAPSVRLGLDPRTGEAECSWSLPVRSEVTEVFRGEPGTDLAGFTDMIHVRGNPTRAFAISSESGSLYGIDFRTTGVESSARCILSGTDGSGEHERQDLNPRRTVIVAVNHHVHGHVYCLSSQLSDETDLEDLHLIDHDRDGEIDMVAERSEWRSSDLFELPDYIDQW